MTLTTCPDAVDVAFAVQCAGLPRDHAASLAAALCERLPWLAQEPLAGIHPIRVVHGLGDLALLSQRTRLLLRVPVSRVQDLQALDAAELDVQGQALRLASPQVREFVAHGTLYAHRVAADSVDESAFMAGVTRALALLDIAAEPVCGKHQVFGVHGAAQDVFSLMLHGLNPGQSLRLQQQGLGPQRLLGCGIFVPHKSAAAV
jgi:CRISPR-associated protein Cas6